MKAFGGSFALRCGPFSNGQLRCCAARSARGAAALRQQARLRLAKALLTIALDGGGRRVWG